MNDFDDSTSHSREVDLVEVFHRDVLELGFTVVIELQQLCVDEVDQVLLQAKAVAPHAKPCVLHAGVEGLLPPNPPSERRVSVLRVPLMGLG